MLKVATLKIHRTNQIQNQTHVYIKIRANTQTEKETLILKQNFNLKDKYDSNILNTKL